MKSKVLLIDDSVTIHRVIDLSIDFDRYDIVKVFSKEDAALKIQAEQFDYILLDNKLDNIIISEYISELKQQQKNASIILLVGAFDRFDETDLEKSQADDYLVKPFDSQSLNEKLSSDVDMMPAGIVERIAEADFARDNDDFLPANNLVKTAEATEGITKEEYLENLEEVALDDLTEAGYVEDMDQVEKAGKAENVENIEEPQEESAPVMENQLEEETKKEEINIETDDSTLTAVNNMVSLHDLEEDEDHEDDGAHKAEDDLPLSSIELDEPLEVSKSEDLENIEQAEEASANIEEETEEVQLPIIEDEAEIAENAVENDLIKKTKKKKVEAVEEESIDNTLEDDIAGDNIVFDNNAVAEENTKEEDNTLENINTMADDNTIEDNNIMAEEQEAAVEDEIEMPDKMQAVHSPILPDIDDAATISDDYLMQENLAPVDNDGEEMLQEFPDFPDEEEKVQERTLSENQAVEETEENTAEEPLDLGLGNITEVEEKPVVEEPALINMAEEENINEPLEETLFNEEMQAEETENMEEQTAEMALIDEPVIEEQEEKQEEVTPLFEDDDWLSDAPNMEERINNIENEEVFEKVDENLEETVEENAVEEAQEENELENISLLDEMPQEENIDINVAENENEEINLDFMQEESTVDNNELFENTESEINIEEPVENMEEEKENAEVNDLFAEENLNESLDQVESSEEALENEDLFADNIAEETAEDNVAENMAEDLEAEESAAIEEISLEDNAIQEDNVILEDNKISEDNIIPEKPVMEQAPAVIEPNEKAASEVKEAQEYKQETEGRFGGITVTISRDEIMSMLGNAIDKCFLEEAVKEVIAANMKDIVRNIVPAIAEKYIKEEIERLKNDE